jgi:peptide-methionine (S)-S-oxide reductase
MMQIITKALGMLAVLLPFGGGASCNSSSDVVALPDPAVDAPLAGTKGRETIVVAGGCFWGIQGVFERLNGVLRATSGYSGGAANTATYEKVCSGRQGPDHGTQYRSAIFYTSEEQKKIVDAYVKQLDSAKVFKQPIVTQIVPLEAFYPAEDYHQGYMDLHPENMYIVINDYPKVENLRKHYPSLFVEKK